MNLHDQAIQEAVAEHGEMTTLPTAALLELAAQLKLAAILLADTYGVLPLAVRVNLPGGLTDRITSPEPEMTLQRCLPTHLTEAMLDLVIVEAHERTQS